MKTKIANLIPRRQPLGRWWVVYPIVLTQMMVATWLGQQWKPTDSLFLAAVSISSCLLFPAIFLGVVGSKPFVEFRSVGLLMLLFGSMLMAVTPFAMIGNPQFRSLSMGVSTISCLAGVAWLLVWAGLCVRFREGM